MTGDQLEAILKQLSAKAHKDGFVCPPEGGTLTLYVSHDGASLTIGRVDGVKSEGEIVYARTAKRETYAVVRTDLFALAVEGSTGQPVRRAGF